MVLRAYLLIVHLVFGSKTLVGSLYKSELWEQILDCNIHEDD